MVACPYQPIAQIAAVECSLRAEPSCCNPFLPNTTYNIGTGCVLAEVAREGFRAGVLGRLVGLCCRS